MCWDCDDNSHDRYKEIRQGGVDPEDFDKEVNYRPRKKKKSVKKYPGCPGNEGGAHIYVWTTEYNHATLFFDHYGFHKRESKVCCGCGHKDSTRLSEQYANRNSKEKDKAIRKGQRVWKYWNFEDYDEDYREKRRKYLARRGWDDYVYGGWWF